MGVAPPDADDGHLGVRDRHFGSPREANVYDGGHAPERSDVCGELGEFGVRPVAALSSHGPRR